MKTRMRGKRVTVGRTNVPREMHGLPVYEAASPISFVISEQSIKDAVPMDCDRCAIALSAKNQLQAPIAHIGKAHAYVSIPDEKGNTLEGYGKTKYVVLASILGKAAQRLMRSVDRGEADAVGQVVTLIPRKRAEHPKVKALRNRPSGQGSRNGRTVVKEQGVRNYSGRAWA